jgi:transcriptional regulator GlxA family with amidase domain
LPENQLSWETVAIDNASVSASSGAVVLPDRTIDEDVKFHSIIVFGAQGAWGYTDSRVLKWLRRHASRGTHMGRVMSGAWILARAGLLNGYRCAVHWQDIEAFREVYPLVEISSDIFSFDDQRFSCSGGHVASDMMLHLLSRWFDPLVTTEVREVLLHERLRDPEEMQRFSLDTRLAISNPSLLQVVEIMEGSTDSPPHIDQICAETRLSQRRIEQLFRQYFNKTPKQYQLELRLNRARDLLLATTLPVREIAPITGFSNPGHFSTAFGKMFNMPPSSVRN